MPLGFLLDSNARLHPSCAVFITMSGAPGRPKHILLSEFCEKHLLRLVGTQRLLYVYMKVIRSPRPAPPLGVSSPCAPQPSFITGHEKHYKAEEDMNMAERMMNSEELSKLRQSTVFAVLSLKSYLGDMLFTFSRVPTHYRLSREHYTKLMFKLLEAAPRHPLRSSITRN